MVPPEILVWKEKEPEWWKIYHIVRQADLLTAYDVQRMLSFKYTRFEDLYEEQKTFPFSSPSTSLPLPPTVHKTSDTGGTTETKVTKESDRAPLASYTITERGTGMMDLCIAAQRIQIVIEDTFKTYKERILPMQEIDHLFPSPWAKEESFKLQCRCSLMMDMLKMRRHDIYHPKQFTDFRTLLPGLRLLHLIRNLRET